MISEKEIFKTVYENDLVEFTKFAFRVLEPERIYIHNWHIDVICNHLVAVLNGDIKNLNINIPPRTIKSFLANVVFPSWIWTKLPWFKIISASHSADLSTGFNMQRRQLVLSPEYQYYWPIKLLPDLDTQKKFGNTEGGFMQAASVGGSITGKGGDALIGDDILDAMDSFSESKREAANNWFSTAFYNRLQDKKNPKRINIMQRLHENDLTGHINKKYNFENLVIPMQREPEQVQTSLGWVDPRKEGEFLHPERYADKEKEDEYKGLGEYGWAGQMQQRPVPSGGGIVKKEWIKIESVKDLDFQRKIISVDATFKGSKTSDYVSCQVWGKTKTDFCLIDKIKGKWDFITTVKHIKKLEEKHQTKRIFIEDKANGPAIINVLKQELTGVKGINPKDSKEARLHSIVHFFETHNIIFDKNLKDIDTLINELLFFPNAKHDDEVDALTQAIMQLQTSESFYEVGRSLQSY